VLRVSEVCILSYPLPVLLLLEYPSIPPSIHPCKLISLITIKINVPVHLQSPHQEATITPGDILIGDLNGVVCLPQELAEKAVSLMKSQVEADERIAEDLKGGRTFGEASREHRAGLKGV
jgi:regulator of RNase E activity RraA